MGKAQGGAVGGDGGGFLGPSDIAERVVGVAVVIADDALALLANTGTLAWMISRMASQDIAGLAKQVEQMTGIAAAHGVEGLTVETLTAPYGLLISLALLAGAAVLVLLTERRWPKRQAKTELAAKTVKDVEPKDAIGIWDSQRR